MSKEKTMSLANLSHGAAIEKFDDELQRVLDNIMDPNTPTTKREVVLKVKFKPSDNRDFSDIEIHCSSKLAPASAYTTQAYIGKDIHGTVKACEADPKQQTLFNTETPDNVTPIKKEN